VRWIECSPLSMKLTVIFIKAGLPMNILIQMKKNYRWRARSSFPRKH